MLIKFIKDIYYQRRILWSMSKSDFKSKYLGSVLGVIWGFITPLITILIYWFVFEFGLKAGERPDKVPFVLWMVSGMVPWLFFSEVISGASNSLMEYSYIVKKIVFNLKLIPLIKIISSSIVHVLFVILNMILVFSYGYWPTAHWIQLLVIIPYCYITVMAISYFNAAVIPFFRDFPQIISIALQFLFWLTPIIWDMAIVPTKLKWIFLINPLYYIVEGYRSAFVYQQNFLNNNIMFWVMFVCMSLLLVLSIKIYDRFEGSYADVL
ncbi:ABC transporter permease [Paenibacillus phoenicis]|uniref:Transport permease protein n=1 Tax=Paenibacillus phoenicis TaxID=554117 RepID=A0ABU5PN82_9BACL|nr:ABC transporter permease [Paenibacillus phoenicis]MEA3571287.1 ABC transporter permease [Paenibacillus phoenicis]